MHMIDTITTADAEYKDARPIDTVARIKGILHSCGIQTEEIWFESDVPHCYSLRINIAGTAIGSNGKGINRDFALASGYGELIERLQLGHIWRNKVHIEGGVSSADAQSVPVSPDMLLERNPRWYAAFSEKLQQLTGISMNGQQIISQYRESDGNVQATPYYCVTSGTTEYLPTRLIKAVYGTNGGAAGNTMEEAMVQSLSEIVERHHKLRVIFENIPVPEIPEDVLQSCPVAYEIIQFLRSSGYRVIIKDCSLGTKFPVVCVCLINTANGKYHTHFGAHPNFEIALQRTLTETFQGRNIKHITKHENFCYKTDDVFALRYLMTELVKGTSEKPPQFFFRQSEEPYRPTAGFQGANNRECLSECIAFFREQGYDVLVRDCSCLGFPTCQILIPGYSEALPHRLSVKYNDARYSAYANRTLQNPSAAKMEDLLGLMMHIVESNKHRNTGMENFLTEAGIPAVLPRQEQTFLMNVSLAHVSYTLGKYKDVINYLTSLICAGGNHQEYLICLKRYLSLLLNRYTPAEIRATLDYLHNPQTVAQLYDCLNNRKNPLDALVLHCDMQCRPDCRLFDRCQKKRTDELVQLIVDRSKEVDQSALINKLQAV